METIHSRNKRAKQYSNKVAKKHFATFCIWWFVLCAVITTVGIKANNAVAASEVIYSEVCTVYGIDYGNGVITVEDSNGNLWSFQDCAYDWCDYCDNSHKVVLVLNDKATKNIEDDEVLDFWGLCIE